MEHSGKEVQRYGEKEVGLQPHQETLSSMLKDEKGNQQYGYVVAEGEENSTQFVGIRKKNAGITGDCSHDGASISGSTNSKGTVVDYQSLDANTRPVKLLAVGKGATASVQVQNASNVKAHMEVTDESSCEIM